MPGARKIIQDLFAASAYSQSKFSSQVDERTIETLSSDILHVSLKV